MQLGLDLKERFGLVWFGWGGARRGAGRKRQKRAGVPHRERPAHCARHPAHVTLRVVRGLPNLRKKRAFRVIEEAISRAAHKETFRLVHFSVQGNHIHLIVEADDARALASGVQGFEIRLARGINALTRRRGRVFSDRYHARPLKTPREVRNAIAYVVMNGAHHKVCRGLDHCSSARCFDIWTPEAGVRPPKPWRLIVAQPESWLLDVGWRRHGLISPAEMMAFA
jgi:REP element-mobilizing transposase RayT